MALSSKPPPPRSEHATSVGVEHALLSYGYLDAGDLDGYASLVDRDARFAPTGASEGRGPEAAAALAIEHCGSQGRHRPERVIASGSDVIVTGALTRTRPVPERSATEEFADFFTVSEHGLLSTWRRFRAPDAPT
ncbi:nuclear transport factor 2 family protein [Nocardiopsis terrae]